MFSIFTKWNFLCFIATMNGTTVFNLFEMQILISKYNRNKCKILILFVIYLKHKKYSFNIQLIHLLFWYLKFIEHTIRFVSTCKSSSKLQNMPRYWIAAGNSTTHKRGTWHFGPATSVPCPFRSRCRFSPFSELLSKYVQWNG